MGGQAFPAFDFALAPYVRKTFIEELDKVSEITGRDYSNYYDVELDEYIVDKTSSNPVQIAMNHTVDRVHQAMESFVHNANTIHSRGGENT